MKIAKEIMIERIVARYIAMNENDYANGYLDEEVKDNCNNYARAFGKTLNGLSEETVSAFYGASRNIQHKVFAYDSACWAATVMPRPFVENTYNMVTDAIEKYGFDKQPFLMEILTPHLNNLKSMLNAEYHDLGNGVVAYTGLNGARI